MPVGASWASAAAGPREAINKKTWILFTEASVCGQMPDMLLTHLSGKLNALAAHWDEQRAKIRTAADLDTRNRFVREKFRGMIHGLPERGALSPMVTATHQRQGYRVENVM